jgi:hypothetical protein
LTLPVLLQFITGTNSIPPLGFDKKITIDFYDATSRKHYPFASTCDLRLWLPRAVEVKELQSLMEEAVACSPGFGKI